MGVQTFSPASSNIEDVEYDDSTDTLTVTFTGGDMYDYMNVPAAVYRAFASAPSAGQFFHRQIKGRYQYDGPK
jgi:lysyl-tRNA synthetase class 2